MLATWLGSSPLVGSGVCTASHCVPQLSVRKLCFGISTYTVHAHVMLSCIVHFSNVCLQAKLRLARAQRQEKLQEAREAAMELRCVCYVHVLRLWAYMELRFRSQGHPLIFAARVMSRGLL